MTVKGCCQSYTAVVLLVGSLQMQQAMKLQNSLDTVGGASEEVVEIELQHAEPEAPDVTGVAVVDLVIEVGVDALQAHIGINKRVARIHGLGHDSAYAEISDLDMAASVDKEVQGLDVMVEDALSVEIREPDKDLPGHINEEGLQHDVPPFEEPAVHILQENLDLTGVVVKLVAAYHEGLSAVQRISISW
ncbi:hypothetical protein J5N97_004146 [Dioscorea zingiberensis]|uniref:Uncharacterized protein n=1 Tax=Dioscorea zingiberensis TaxID=325984 RepID=A0A9D5D5I1_9LILI|nr:hypothetical protein J5N97_004146 [Dioscorea zingiberensis]